MKRWRITYRIPFIFHWRSIMATGRTLRRCIPHLSLAPIWGSVVEAIWSFYSKTGITGGRDNLANIGQPTKEAYVLTDECRAYLKELLSYCNKLGIEHVLLLQPPHETQELISRALSRLKYNEGVWIRFSWSEYWLWELCRDRWFPWFRRFWTPECLWCPKAFVIYWRYGCESIWYKVWYGKIRAFKMEKVCEED